LLTHQFGMLYLLVLLEVAPPRREAGRAYPNLYC